MIIYYTQSASHLAPLLKSPLGSHKVVHFSDGELLLEIDPILLEQEVWVVGSTMSPAENSQELFLLLDALARAGAIKINLLLLYFGYARQALPKPGQANGAELMCRFLRQFPLDKIALLHPHNPQLLQQWLPHTNLIPFDFFTTTARDYDAIVAPDAGAASLAQAIATECSKELIVLHKIRSYEQISIRLLTGDIAQAAKLLADCGAQEIAAAVTHGLFAGNAQQLLTASPIAKIYVTNSIAQRVQEKVEVYDVSHLLRSFFLPSGPS
jgi:ribose-phosphate pyrophosphokinase